MKKINILSMALVATTLISASSVFAADHDHEDLQKATKTFEDLAVKSGKLTTDNQNCWGQMKKSLDVK
jgi:hypothetical protein